MTMHAMSADPALAGRGREEGRFVMRFVQTMRRRWWRARTWRALNELSDDMLKDVGVYRCQLDLVAAEAADAVTREG